MRFPRCLLPVFIGFLSTPSSALTQTEMSQAVYDALMSFSEYGSGVPGWVMTFPLGSDYFDLSSYLTDGFGGTVGQDLYFVLSNMVGTDPRFWNFLRSVVMGSSTNIYSLLQQKLDVPLSDLDDSLSDVVSAVEAFDRRVHNQLSDISASAFDIRTALYGLHSLTEDLASAANSNSTENLQALDGLQLALSDIDMYASIIETSIQNIEVSADDSYQQLYFIRQHTYDAASSASQIVNWLENNWLREAETALANFLLNLPDHYDVTVDNMPSIPDYSSALSGIGSDLRTGFSGVESAFNRMGVDTAQLNTNFAAFADTATDFFDSATNFYGRMLPTEEQIDLSYSATNSVVTNAVAEYASDEADVSSLTNELDSLTPDFTDVFSQNPYDGASLAENLQTSVEALVDDVDPATTSDVILFGSVSRSRSGGWSSWIQKIPRIEFNMEYLFTKWQRLGTIRNLFRALWLVIGVFFKLMLLSKFLTWFSQHSK